MSEAQRKPEAVNEEQDPIVLYELDGTPLTRSEYTRQLDEAIEELDKYPERGISHEQVRKEMEQLFQQWRTEK
jgi:hypothetical protein